MNWVDFTLIGIVVIIALTGMRIGVIGAAFNVVGVLIGWFLAGQYSDDVGELFGDSLSNDTIVTVISYAVIVIVAVIASRFVAKIVKPLLTVFTLGMSGMVDRLGGLAMGLVVGLIIASALIVAGARLAYDFDVTESGFGQLTNLDAIKSAVESTLSGQELTDQLAKIEEVRGSLDETMSEAEVSDHMAKLDDMKKALEATEAGAKVAEQVAANFEDVKGALGGKAAEVKEALEDALVASKLVSTFVNVTSALPADAMGFVPSDFKEALNILDKATP